MGEVGSISLLCCLLELQVLFIPKIYGSWEHYAEVLRDLVKCKNPGVRVMASHHPPPHFES